MEFEQVVRLAAQTIEGIAVAILVIGTAVVLVRTAVGIARPDRSTEVAYQSARQGLGKVLLLGLEVLIAGDVIATVAIDQTIASVGALAGIVLIRIVLSWSIEMETAGHWPWRRSTARADTEIARSHDG